MTRLAQAVDIAVDKFVEEGKKIAQENPKIQADILKACHNVSTAGVCVCVFVCFMLYGMYRVGPQSSVMISSTHSYILCNQ